MNKLKKRYLQPMILALSLMAVCGSAQAADNIVKVADKAGTFKTLLAAAKAAGLVDALQGDGPLTVFAPTDDAFAKLPKHTLNDLLKPENKEKLATILKYHVISGKVAAKDAVQVESAETLSGDSVSISIRDGRLTVNNANVIVNDVEATNGIIHVIDSVLMPPEDRTIVGVASRAGKFKTLLAAAEAVGLLDALKDKSLSGLGITVFAPTDEAFAKLPEHTLDDLLKPQNKDKLAAILKYHILFRPLTSAYIRRPKPAAYIIRPKQASEPTVLPGARVRFGRTEQDIARVNEVNIVGEDIRCDNGIIQVIDTVLMPPEDRTIVGGADQYGIYKTLLAAAKAAGLLETLRGEGPFTLFAPTDAAFAKLPEHTLTDLLKPQNKEKLAAILKYHVVNERLTVGGIRSRTATATTLQGATVVARKGARVNRSKGALVNDANIIVGDFPCSNGNIIAIDRVLMPPKEDKSIVGVATEAGSFTILLAAAKAAGLLDTLTSKGPYTVFAPTDEAFGKLPDGTLESLLKPENKERLTAILTYHVVPRKLTKSDAIIFADSGLFERPDPFAHSQISKRPDERGLSTVNGRKLEITSVSSSNPKRFPWKLLVNDATIVKADLAASNGVIHAIDSVLMPPADETKQHKKTAHTVSSAKVGGSSATSHSDIVAAAAAAGNFKTLIAAIKAAGLAETLKGDGPFTVLAPSDEAFAKLPIGTIETLLKPENKEQLVAILKYHVIQGRRTAGELPHWGGARSLQGTVIRIRSNAPLTFNNSKVVKPDINCSNGVIHVVDTVLMPDDAPEGPFDQDSEFRLLQRLDPALTSHLKSVRGGNETSVVFSNLSSKPIQVYWIAFDGQRKKWREPIEPGSLDICDVSFDKHVWLLTDEHDNALGLYILDKQNGFVIHK